VGEPDKLILRLRKQGFGSVFDVAATADEATRTGKTPDVLTHPRAIYRQSWP